MKPVPGIYEVYIGKSKIEAVTAFREKYGYLPDDVQQQGIVVLTGPVKYLDMNPGIIYKQDFNGKFIEVGDPYPDLGTEEKEKSA